MLEDNCHQLAAKYAIWEKDEVRWETYNTDGDFKLLVTSYGMMARICSTAIDELKEEGIEVGLIRPISLYPFPTDAVAELADRVDRVMSVEMSMGQMIEDVQLAVGRDKKVAFFGRTGGVVPSPDEVAAAMRKEIAR